MKKLKPLITATIAAILCLVASGTLFAQDGETKTGYLSVNGLEMYYEIHGTDQEGTPVVLLHGAFGNVAGPIETLARQLAGSRKVITFAMQAHGRTADIERPITIPNMAGDVAAALSALGYEQADVFGYSMGGGIALELTVQHPQLVRKLIPASVAFSEEGTYPELREGVKSITPEMFEGSPFKQYYDSLAPNPEDFAVLIEKIKKMGSYHWSLTEDQIRSVKAPVMLIIGDADIIRPEHAVKTYRLLGGGRLPNFTAIPYTQLAVLPGTRHIGVMMQGLDWIIPMVERFLEQPMPKAD